MYVHKGQKVSFSSLPERKMTHFWENRPISATYYIKNIIQQTIFTESWVIMLQEAFGAGAIPSKYLHFASKH